MDNMELKGCMSVNYWLVCFEWILFWKVINRVECELMLLGGFLLFYVLSDGIVGVVFIRSMREYNFCCILVVWWLNFEVDFYYIEVSGCYLNRFNFVRCWKIVIFNRLYMYVLRFLLIWLRVLMRYIKVFFGFISMFDN